MGSMFMADAPVEKTACIITQFLKKSKAAPRNSASASGESFCSKIKFEKRRIGANDPPKAAGAIVRDCPKFVLLFRGTRVK